jgi:hypothetical protein
MDAFPAVKFFSATDQTQVFPTPITCYRVDKAVAGANAREWAGWFKLLRYLDGVFP